MGPQVSTIFWPQPLAWHTATLVVQDERCASRRTRSPMTRIAYVHPGSVCYGLHI